MRRAQFLRRSSPTLRIGPMDTWCWRQILDRSRRGRGCQDSSEDVPDELKKDPKITGVQKELELAEETADAGDTTELSAAVAANPDDHESRIALAIALYGGQRMRKRQTNCLRVSVWTGNGMTALPERSWLSSLKPGA